MALGKWLTTRTTTLLGLGKCTNGMTTTGAVDSFRGHVRVNEGEQNEGISQMVHRCRFGFRCSSCRYMRN